MKYSKQQKSLSQPIIDLLSHMSKLVDKGLSPQEAVEWMQEVEGDWRCSRGYPFTKGGLRQAQQRLERKIEMMKQVNNGVTVFINNKPKQ